MPKGDIYDPTTAPKRPPYEMNVEDCFRFGKYRGRPFYFVLRQDTGYINWCLNTGIFYLSESAVEYYVERTGGHPPISPEAKELQNKLAEERRQQEKAERRKAGVISIEDI